MKKIILSTIMVGICLVWSALVLADEYPVVVSVSEYKIDPGKYDEVSDPDVYFEIFHNGSIIETSKTVRDYNFKTYGEMKPFGDYCVGIRNLVSGDSIKIVFYDSDYNSGVIKRFWEWVQGSLYKNIVYYDKQVELMNNPDKKYDDHDAYKTATEDPELKQKENVLTDNIMEIRNRRNNRRDYEYIGEAFLDIGPAIKEFESGNVQYASDFEIKDPRSSKKIGKVNVIIQRFEGYGASLKVKGY